MIDDYYETEEDPLNKETTENPKNNNNGCVSLFFYFVIFYGFLGKISLNLFF